jgi:membrane fusion protein, multidrug efflux system
MNLLPKRIIEIRRQYLKSSSVVLICIFMLSGCNFSKSSEDTKKTQIQAPIQVVDVLELQPQTATLVTELTGRVRAITIAEVRPQVDGIVLKREFREGSDIAKGEMLYRIDAAIYQAELSSAKASLAQSLANLKAAKSKASRYKNLVAKKAISLQDFDDSDALYKRAIASVNLAKARLRQTEINLSYTEVKSPIDGRIGRSSITQGALVTANQPESLAIIQQLDPIYVDITQSSVELLRMRLQVKGKNKKRGDLHDGISVRLELEDGSLYSQVGQLAFSEVSVNENTGSVTLRAVFSNPEQLLLPGMFVRATVETTTIEDALMLPPLAVSRTSKGEPTVMVVSPQSMVELRMLEQAEMVNGQWLIKGGVVPGEKIIVGGLQKVFPGMPVQVSSKKPEVVQLR